MVCVRDDREWNRAFSKVTSHTERIRWEGGGGRERDHREAGRETTLLHTDPPRWRGWVCHIKIEFSIDRLCSLTALPGTHLQRRRGPENFKIHHPSTFPIQNHHRAYFCECTTCVCVCVCVYVCGGGEHGADNAYIYVYTDTHTHTHTTHTHTHAHTHTFTNTHTRIYICIYIHMYVWYMIFF